MTSNQADAMCLLRVTNRVIWLSTPEVSKIQRASSHMGVPYQSLDCFIVEARIYRPTNRRYSIKQQHRDADLKVNLSTKHSKIVHHVLERWLGTGPDHHQLRSDSRNEKFATTDIDGLSGDDWEEQEFQVQSRQKRIMSRRTKERRGGPQAHRRGSL